MARNKFNVDETLESDFDVHQLIRSMVYIKRYKKYLIGAFFFSLTASFMSLLIPLFTQNAIDEMIPNKDIKGLIIAALLITGTIIIQAICNKLRSRCSAIAGQAIIRDIRSDLFKHLQELPFDFFDSRPHGKILVRVINYVNGVSDFLTNGMINVILELVNLVMIIGFMFFLHWKLALVVFSGVPIILIFLILIRGKQRHAWQKQANKRSNFVAYLAESINGERVSQSFARQKYNASINKDLSQEAQDSYLDAVLINHTFWPVTYSLQKFVTYALYAAGVLIFRNSISIGILISMVTYSGRFWTPIQNISAYYNQMINTVSYLERIFQLMDEPVNVTDCEGATELPKIQGLVEFKDVYFEYEKNVPVLKDVSFTAKPGESIALVGPTGAGKSTIINLVSRFYNLNSGEVSIDGHDISKVTLKSLRSQMGIMLQDTFIFSGSIIENIRYGRLDATDEECMEAAKKVHADEFITLLPNGYYTEVDEHGDILSAGQRQLLSFARTMLSDPRILILDEATSSIDTNTEILVQQGIKELLKNRTSFIVAHRLSTIKGSDRIMYICDGKIAESGSHEELLEQKGLYYKLYTSQLSAQ